MLFNKCFLIVLFVLSISSCKSVYSIQKFTHQVVQLDSIQLSSSKISDIINPYKIKLDETMNEVVCKTSDILSKSKPESKLGNLVADATFFEAKEIFNQEVDLAIVNYGGIRVSSLPKGDITLGNIYELMPFDNYINLIYVKGNVLKEVCDLISFNGGWPISGIQFLILEGKAENIIVQGKELDLNKIYKVAISDYLANGGDNMLMLKTLKREKSDLLLRDAFIQYFKKFEAEGKLVDIEIENRILVK